MEPQLMEKKTDPVRPFMDERKSRRTQKSLKADITTDASKEFAEKYGESLYTIIETVVFEFGEDNHATRTFAELMEENKPAAMKLIYDIYVRNIDDERLCENLLKILRDYTYEEFLPYSREIAVSSLSHKSIWVKSAAFSLMSHWGWDSREAFDLLKNAEVPSEYWIQLKYNSIKSSLEEVWSMREK